jgi:hypothetical protein
LGETLQYQEDEKQEQKDRFHLAGTPFPEEHDRQSMEHQLEPLVDVPESRNVPEITRTTRTKRQFWAYEPEEEELPTQPTPTSFTDEQGRRRNPPRTARNNAGEALFMTYTGPAARNMYLASEMGWILTTGFDKDEPNTVQEALSGPQRQQWKKAMDRELDNLRMKETWQAVKAPQDRAKIGARWVLKIKRDAEGNIIKYKARLVAKGYSQIPGIDFEETYAPVGRTTSLRILLAISSTLDLEVYQADVEGAYLNGKLDIDIYMEYPEGVKPKPGCDALLLKKSLYGLKQSGRTWWIELGNKLATLGFERLESDWGLYVKPQTPMEDLVLILVYVDDFVIAARTTTVIQYLLKKLKGFWKLSEMGEISTILGMKVTRNRTIRKAWVTQPAYIDRLLERFPQHLNYRTKAAPLPKISEDNSEPIPLTPYQEIIGCLQWLAGCTRPDISFAASYLARYTANPTENHWELALRTTSYLAHTRTVGLALGGPNQVTLSGWVDADWAGCHDTRRSTTGYLFKINNSPIVWSSKRQQTVSTSTVEAEYIAITEAAKEALWLRNLLKELGFENIVTEATVLHTDNQGAIRLAINPSTHQRTKHIDIRHHLIRELIHNKSIALEYVTTGEQQADILTKPLPGPRHSSNLIQLGLGEPRA